MSYTATYSPEDNKLRLYASARLDKELYDRVRAAGFIWAPKQELFVAPMWTPSREDLLLELADEIGDEDTSLVDRAEERSERFEDYSDSRAQDAERAHEAVSAIVDNIPLGQPILVGHHSERHARKDAEKIEAGMRRAVKMWETAEYWKRRAAGAIHHAKYKELPSVRARRIKGIEADQRKQQKNHDESERKIKLWANLHDDNAARLQKKDGAPSTFLERARFLANIDSVGVVKREDSTYHSYWSAWDVLRPDGERYEACPSLTPEQVQEKCIVAHQRNIAHCDRWLTHYANRLEYERAMLADSGGIASDRTGPEKGGACRCWASPGRFDGGWSYIQKVNKVSVTVLDNWGNGGGNFTRTIPFDKLAAVMSKAEVEAARAAGMLKETVDKIGFFLLQSREQFDAAEARIEVAPPEPADQGEKFDAMRTSLKAGIKIVSAPQLFPTPPDLARRMVELAEIGEGNTVLEPSAGTGVIVDAIGRQAAITAVEINHTLAHRLAFNDYLGASRVHEKDFLECNGDLGKFDRILMNPPFENASDIKHITHALTFLKPGGRLVAICANGPRQSDKLKPLAATWEPLPADTFKQSGTGVNTVLLTIEV